MAADGFKHNILTFRISKMEKNFSMTRGMYCYCQYCEVCACVFWKKKLKIAIPFIFQYIFIVGKTVHGVMYSVNFSYI